MTGTFKVLPNLQVAPSGNPASIGAPNVGQSQYAAAADHMHAFGPALQKARISVATNGVVTWTFDTPFVDNTGVAVIPIIGCVVESPSTTTVFGEPQITVISNTSVTLQIKVQATAINIVLGNLNLFGAAVPANTYLHVSARNPSV